jgi:hypothetical protein
MVPKACKGDMVQKVGPRETSIQKYEKGIFPIKGLRDHVMLFQADALFVLDATPPITFIYLVIDMG